jgi:transglutaminase-like putative cysteine protease
MVDLQHADQMLEWAPVSRIMNGNEGSMTSVHETGITMSWRRLFVAIAIFAAVNSVRAQEKKADAKSRSFLFSYAGTVKDLKPGQSASVWLPVAVSGPEQEVFIQSSNLPASSKTSSEKQYGNTSLFFESKADGKGEIWFEVVYSVKRREVKTDEKSGLALKPATSENVSRFLQSDAKVPISGKPLELIKDTKLPDNQFAAARVLYDVVNTHMKYSKEGNGWGQGDSVWACDSKFGNCSDFHSLFISMARGNKIPSKFEMGFPIPTKRGEGAVGGYHCWAWFLPNDKGWVPVDISEANRNPELKEYYFGNLTEDRVRFTTGRDINLEPRQKGPPLNFFIYPYVEVDGQPYPQERIERRFAYKDVK